MKNIFQTLLFRLKKSTMFWVLFGACALLPLLEVGMNLLAFFLYNAIGVDEFTISWEAMKNGITIGAMSALPAISLHAMLAIICTSIFLSKEFMDGTFRNALLANRSRRELYLSYLLMAVTIGGIMFGVNYLSTLLLNGAFFGFGDMAAADAVTACFVSLGLGLISVIFLQTMMCMFLFGTRKLAVALACPLVIAMIAPSVLYSFIDVFARFHLIKPTDMSWVPLYNLNLLSLFTIDGALIGKILLYLVPLTVLFGCLGWVSFRKADLK